MRDITQKINTLRSAVAKATLRISPSTIQMIKDGKVPKGDPLAVAKVAAIQAAKNCSQIIPYCHPVPLTHVLVEFNMGEDEIDITTTVKALYKTGVEMEALTAASVAALTIYDMVKMLDEVMLIESVRLESKVGGKSSFRKTLEKEAQAAVFCMSDTAASGQAEDISGKLIQQRLEAEGMAIAKYKILPDDESVIIQEIRHACDELAVDLVVTTGGTGVSPRDHTPEAVSRLIERQLPGVTEAIRAYGQQRNPYSMLSRSLAGIRNKTIILCLPGSPGGVQDSLDAVFPALLHAFKMIAGEGHGARNMEKTKP